ncbi:MAG: hypothetical protein MJA29_13470, partial [Candidatus Omnitrophica bacterium]|nr:hypothetical protein [Candidatus Omnitrophota bacterium]
TLTLTFDMESLFSRISSHVAEAVATATSKAILDTMKKFAELDRKKDNIVMFNLKPDSSVSDKDLVASLLDDAGLSSGDDPIDSYWRDGPSFPNRPRLLKIKFKDRNLRNQYLSFARAKKFPSPIYIRRDLTYKERMARKMAAM